MITNRKYQKTLVLGEDFIQDTGNEYLVVSQRPYKDKKGILDDGVLMTLQITKDNNKYPNGEDNMVFQTFDVYVLCGSHITGLVKGDLCSLHNFLPDYSYYIDYNYILRFNDVKKIERK